MPQTTSAPSHFKVARALFFSLCALFLLSSASHAAIAPTVVEHGKKATAYISIGTGSGSAFCISASGLFVTDAHVVAGTKKISLVLNPSEANERVLNATVVRADSTNDLAVLKADGAGPFEALELGPTTGLRETMNVVAFGYPFGKELAIGKQTYPSISVNAGTISALRKTNEVLERIQLDSVLNPGNSGGPVLNETGQVIGIVKSGIPGTGVNFATPVNQLRSFLSKPEIIVNPAPLYEDNTETYYDFPIEILTLGTGDPDPTTLKASLSLQRGSIKDAFIFPQTVVNNKANFRIPVLQLRPLLREQQPAALGISYKVVVRNGLSIVAEKSGLIPLQRDPAKIPLISTIQAPDMVGDKVVISLPAAIDDVAVGGAGRYLVLYLKRLHKLAVFDVSTTKIKYLSLTSENSLFAASAQKLVVVSPEQNTVERYDLATLTRELTVAKPDEGEVRSITMGSASFGPLMVVSFGGFGQSRTSVLDIGTLQKIDVAFNKSNWGSVWGDQTFQVRASEDGAVFTGWFNGLSPSGLHVLRLNGNSIDSSYQHESVGYVLAGQDGSRIYTSRGLYTSDLQALDPAQFKGASCLPAYGDAYFLTIMGKEQSRQGGFGGFGGFDAPHPMNISVYSTTDRKLLLTLPDLEELSVNSGTQWAREVLTLEKRIHFYPGANLLVTVPDTKDSLIVRRFNLLAALDKAGIDYLFVSSTPVPAVRKGGTYTYQLDVKSKRAGVTYTLDSAPPGATLSPKGLFTWKVPKDYTGTGENIITSIRDASGQQIFHSFKVRVLP